MLFCFVPVSTVFWSEDAEEGSAGGICLELHGNNVVLCFFVEEDKVL
jgi:hypothetical protein